MKLTTIICATALVLAITSPADAGTFFFYSKDNAEGKLLGSVDDTKDADMDLTDKNHKHWKNDEIRSVKVVNVAKGTVLELWDSSDKRRSDDWVRITFLQDMVGTTIFGNMDNKYDKVPAFRNIFKYERFGKNDTREALDNLAGKVSHIVVKSGPHAAVYTAIDSKFSFDKKDSTAHEFKTQDHNYRLYRPSIADSPDGGVVIVFKIDHIRGAAKDDHVVATLTFNAKGLLVEESVEVKMAGNDPITEIFDLNAEQPSELADATEDPKAKLALLASASAAGIAKNLVKALGNAADSGGREVLIGVIELKIATISTEVMKIYTAKK